MGHGKRIHGPDVLRGLAAIGVVFFHVLYLSGVPVHDVAKAVVGRFDFFVRIFFVLSAFAISHAYYDRLSDLDSIRTFYVKRFLRIAPLFYAVLLFGVLYTVCMGRAAPPAFDILLSLSFLFQFVPGKQDGLVGGGWSIGVEWIFYALFPMMAALIKGWRSALFASLLLCLIAVLGRSYFSHFVGGELRVFGLLYFLSHAHYFMIGIMLFHLYKAFPHGISQRFTRTVSGIAFVVTMVGTMLMFYLQRTVPEELFLSVAAFVLVYLAVSGLPVWVDNPLTRWFGLISYSIYLVQFPVIQMLGEVGVYRFIISGVGQGIAAYVWSSAVTLGVVIAVSAVTYYGVEKPGQNLLVRSGTKLRGASA
ncbi:acyltransferase family protein [Stutzerimonas kunmingensis]|uniref:acyltransferase family protein n=1 Tax=Stutzerimonas kunmingensis TaxID=1211807 RepID=UPI0028A645E1|nr:acyltransferase [Stutzerimonas kunmingensis]